ncbi:hypothetical protein [Burkholderia sp. PU8-34]
MPVFGTVSSIFIVHQVPSASDWVSIALILSALAIGLKKGRAVFGRKRAARAPQRSADIGQALRTTRRSVD